ncbi:exopolysaccharide biosynthesis polyprenyl glycosylphosphotransferase [Tsuneonella amylolytica]|uniref:exopolysaccharide biosynthesis polyprenyl glycosylphosphotransferase n=1 Tax=Tsuneonella amylolytica TaxID=2338327 RepID=UPI000EA909E3|nr:exopolysaccharide biosynthesis polyprenyl glycosylphosphotransferase [Tsuneonella amylolytica]
MGQLPPHDADMRTAAVALVPSRERRRLRLYLLMVVVDIALIVGAFFVAGRIYLDFEPDQTSLLEAQLLLPLYLTLALQQRAYSIHALQSWRYAAGRAIVALALAAALLIFITFYAKVTATFSRVVFTIGIGGAAALIVASRAVLAASIARQWRSGTTNVLLIDAGGPDISLASAIRLNALEHGIAPDTGDPHALDRLGRFMANMDRVIVSCPLDDRLPWAAALRGAGVKGELVTDRLGDLQPIGLVVEDGWRSLVVSNGPLGMRQRVLKRGFDTVLSVLGLVILSPLLLLVALAIRLEDRGPVLFRQRRLGRGNRFFDVLKFRSMRVHRTDAAGNRSASPGDDRVTRVGRFIRRTSIDELPQLLNVIKGDMSLVGPRPHALGSQAGDKLFWDVDRAYWNRHALKPGVTGLAQIRGYRGATDREIDLTDRLGADLEYIRNWSLRGDLWIIVRTLGVIVHPRAF